MWMEWIDQCWITSDGRMFAPYGRMKEHYGTDKYYDHEAERRADLQDQ